MEKNLTKIISMVEDKAAEYNRQSTNDTVDGIFVAVSRSGMQRETSNRYIKRLAEDNWEMLTTSESQERVFECGEMWMEKWYSTQPHLEKDHFGSLVPSMLNFYIATHATVFVGVAGSSWSNDVWTTRYHQGKGDANFQYTPSGIIPVPNGGLPDAHKNCK